MAWAKNMCARHYDAKRRHGSPHAEIQIKLTGMTPEERFWCLVTKGPDCWGWSGHTRDGYGVLTIGPNRQGKAHRFSYELHKGPIPDGMFICHHCDNRICARPDHLFLGTAKDNTTDMVAKGRGKSVAHLGSDHGMAKLTEETAREILHSTGVARIVAKRFNVSESTVYMIRGRKTWKHVT
jgi:hypothetical protein